jgi:hypothetical protein
MRIVAIPTPLAAEPFGSVAIGIELLTPHAVRAARIQFTVVAIDAAGRARARVRFTTNFTGASSGTAAWTRTGSRIDIGPGSYQIKVAAAGAEMRGSVFTEVTVPKFGDDLGVGGLSLGAPAALSAGPADRLSGVLPLIPFATRDVSADADAAAQLPIRISSKAASRPLAIAATLVRPDGTTLQLDRASHVTRDYTGTAGKVYRVSIPPRLADGSYRLIVETTLGRAHVTRELTFRVTSAP